MRQKLFTITDLFKIAGRGIVVVGECQPNLPVVKLQEPIVLVLPDETQIFAEVGGVDIFQTVSGVKKIGVLIRNLTKESVPVGTTIFLDTPK